MEGKAEKYRDRAEAVKDIVDTWEGREDPVQDLLDYWKDESVNEVGTVLMGDIWTKATEGQRDKVWPHVKEWIKNLHNTPDQWPPPGNVSGEAIRDLEQRLKENN
jgi:hypothetical protein